MIPMTPALYMVCYPFVWWGILTLTLGLCRLKVKDFLYPLLVSVTLLSTISVTLQINDLAFLTGSVQPVCLILCLWYIFRFRLSYSVLVIAVVYASFVVLEYLYNLILASFDLQKTIFYYQNDRLIIFFLLPATAFVMYAMLHRLRWGFSFLSTRIIRTELDQMPRLWLSLLVLGFLLSLNLALSIYFHSHLVLIFILSYMIIGAALLLLYYRKELNE